MLKLDKKSPDFDLIVGESPELRRIASGFGFTEGPLWRGDRLLFSDIPNNRIVDLRLKDEGPEVFTFRYPSGNANGNTQDRQGRILTCEHSNRRVTRTEEDGSITVIASSFEGKRLNSPNDIVVDCKGFIYFTDPTFGLPNRIEGKELAHQGLYRVDPVTFQIELLVDNLKLPNGLAFSLNEESLYVDDSELHHIRIFNVEKDGSLSGGEVFAELKGTPEEIGVPDGMKVDTEGNIYCTARGGLWVLNSNGGHLGRMIFPEIPANCGWGGKDNKTLFLTARTSVYAINLEIPGNFTIH